MVKMTGQSIVHYRDQAPVVFTAMQEETVWSSGTEDEKLFL